MHPTPPLEPVPPDRRSHDGCDIAGHILNFYEHHGFKGNCSYRTSVHGIDQIGIDV